MAKNPHPYENYEYPYEYYVDIVTKRYFDGVDNKNLQKVLDCFHADAVLTEVTSSTVHDGIDNISRMFQDLFANFNRLWHGNFWHTVDVDTQAICSQFTVELTDPDNNEVVMQNCNRFYLEDGKFKRVYVYMSGTNVLV